MSHHWKATIAGSIVSVVLAICICIITFLTGQQVNNQQRQIDQNSAMILKMVRSEWVVESEGNVGLESGKIYEFQFADFKEETAVLKIVNPHGSDGRTHCIIIHGVGEKILREWEKRPLID